MTGATVHLVDATLDGGPIVAQEAVPVLPGDDEAALHARIQAVEHRLLPRVVALLLAGAVAVGDDGRHTTIDSAVADASVPVPQAGPPVRLGQDRAGRPRSRARRPRLGARVDRRHGPDAARRRAAGHRRGRRDRLAGDARRAGQDPAPADPRRPARRSPTGGPPPAAPRRRHRAVRARRRQPVPVRRRARAAGHHGRRAHRGDRHRRAVDGPGRGQEPRQRRHRDLAGPLRGDPRRARQPTPGSTIGCVASSPSRRSPTPRPTTPASPPSCRDASSRPACSTRPTIRTRRR